MSDTITIASMATPTLRNKKIEPDENGFYDVILSTLDVYNSQGEYYPFNKTIEEILSNSSTFMIKANRNQLYGELEHPNLTGNLTDAEKIHLFTTVNPERVCALIIDIRFFKSKSINPQTGRPYVIVRGRVKPMEPFGHILKNSLETPEANTAWSLRGEYSRSFKGNVLVKSLTQFFTWDFVLAQGLPMTDKIGNLTLESIDHVVIDSNNVDDIITGLDDKLSDSLTSESDSATLMSVKESLKVCRGVDCMIDTWG